MLCVRVPFVNSYWIVKVVVETYLIQKNTKMSSNGVILTNSIEQHRSLLNSIFKFKPASLLHSFITIKTGVSKSLFTLAEVNFELYNIFLSWRHNVFYLDSDNIKRHHSRGGLVWWKESQHYIMFPGSRRSTQYEGASCYRDQV